MAKLARARRRKHPFHHRTEFRREIFFRLREVMEPRKTLPRRLAARQSAGRATLAIPRSRGFRVFPPGQFSEVDEIVRAAQDTVKQADIDARRRANKPTFMIRTLDTKRLTLDSPLLRLALRDDVLASITAYLGVVPVLTKINVFYSHGSDQELKTSQLYHCDGEATSQLKIFVLCSEVRAENGPLTVIGADTSRILRRKVRYVYGERVTDEQMLEAIGGRDQHALTGPPGTVCFVDTSRCFHYGSRVKEGAAPRTVALVQFLPHFALPLLRNYEGQLRFKHLATPEMPRLTQMVLGAR